MVAMRFKWVGPGPQHEVFTRCLELGLGQSVMLVVPGRVRASAQRRRLAGPRSPDGFIVGDADGGQMVAFHTDDLLAWFVAKGLATMTISEEQ